MVLSLHVETLVDPKKSIAENKSSALRNTTFSVDGLPNNETLAAVTAAILGVIAGEDLTAEKIPFSQGADVYLYGYPTTRSVKYKELTPLRSDAEFQENIKTVAARSEPEDFTFSDISCVTNVTDVVKAPGKWKGGPWLGRDDLIVACDERGISLPQSSTGERSLTTKQIKEILQPYQRGETFHQKTNFDLFVVVQAKSEGVGAEDIAKKKKKKKTALLVELLHPAVYKNPNTFWIKLHTAARLLTLSSLRSSRRRLATLAGTSWS
jgi:hypothetical protein